MPRSPSPPRFRRYREDSPPRFRDRRDQGERSWGDYHRRRRDWDRDEGTNDGPARGRSRSRSRERYRSPLKPGQPSEGRSGTPEEGQITSPARLPARLPPKPRSPPPFRPRSPSPPPFRRRSPSPPPFRRRSPSPLPLRRRSPSPGSLRRRYSPSPPPPRRRSPSALPIRRRSPSLPPKRRLPSPRGYRERPWDRYDRDRPRFHSRSRSPPPPRRSPTPSSISSRTQSSRYRSPEKRPLPSPPKPRAPSPLPRHTPPQPTIKREPIVNDTITKRETPPALRVLPTGPKAVPTGPRALAGTAGLPARPHHPNPYVVHINVQEELPPQTKQEPLPSPSVESINPYSRPPQPVAAPRLSWSERKSLVSPLTPTAGLETNVNPYMMGRQSSDAGMKVEIPSKKKVEEKPRMSEAEMAELRAREEQERILAELPAAKVSHGGATWEIELANHYKAMQALQQNTFRAQSAARHAAAVLADAEAERIAAVERRKVVEAQLVAGSLGVAVGAGIMGA